MTATGVILGTAAYMSPEQARGKPVDKRADIWAFGCVLYQMLTGRPAFDGETVTDVLGAVVRAEPDWSRLPPETPGAVRTLLRRCLQKDPAKRLRDIGDAVIELDDRESAPSATTPEPPRRLDASRYVAVALTVVVAGTIGWMLGRSRGGDPPAPIRLAVETSPLRVVRGTFESLALSTDGRDLFFIGEQDSIRAVFRRPLGENRIVRVSGTEGATYAFLSPDGQSIGFIVAGTLKQISRLGGSGITICAANIASAVWIDSGTILFVQPGVASAAGVFQVAANGGKPSHIELAVGAAEVAAVPGARAALITTNADRQHREIHLFDLDSRRLTRLVAGEAPRFMPPDILIFTREETLFVARLDLAVGVTTTEPVALLDGVRFFGTRAPLVAASAAGHIAYDSESPSRESLVTITRSGAVTPVAVEAETIAFPSLAPDGRTVAVSMVTREGEHVWLIDLARWSRVRLTTRMVSRRPAWAPDGKHIAFMSTQDVYSTALGDAAPPTKLIDRGPPVFPDAWSPDGRALLFSEGDVGPRDTGVFRDGRVEMLLTGPANERGGAFSPDGRWLLFVSDESGRDELYVQPYPGGGAKTPVSTTGGLEGTWSLNGREIYYREGDRIMAVPFDSATGRIGPPVHLFDAPAVDYRVNPSARGFVATPDGRFLFVRSRTGASAQIQVALNMATEIRQKLAR